MVVKLFEVLRLHLFRRTPSAPAKMIWRISAYAPMGEWVSKSAPVTKPGELVPEVGSGTWIRSKYDLLDGADVTEHPATDDLFEEWLASRQDDKKPVR